MAEAVLDVVERDGGVAGDGLGLRLASIAAGFARSVWPSEISHL